MIYSGYNPSRGDIIFDVNDDCMKVWGGNNWTPISKDYGMTADCAKYLNLKQSIEMFLLMKNIPIEDFHEFLESQKVANKLAEER